MSIIDLEGGTINAGELNRSYTWSNPGICDINLAGGTLILDGDQTGIVEWFAGEGWIYYGNGKSVKHDYNITNSGKTTVTDCKFRFVRRHHGIWTTLRQSK